ncbi:MAG: serine hydrolase [Pseudomonadota bacterium]
MRFREQALIRSVLVVLFTVFSSGCQKDYEWDGSIANLLASQPERFATVLEDPEKYRIQIIYTQIDRNADNLPIFQSYTYRLDADEYFYPASTVKLPAAVLALEGLNVSGRYLGERHTEMLVGDEKSGESIARSIEKIAVVSDNAAFNRLYEFVGPDVLTGQLEQLSFDGVRIMHRLGIPMSLEENRVTAPVAFRTFDENVQRHTGRLQHADHSATGPVLRGRAEYVSGKWVGSPKDFASKNAYPLQAQHDVIKQLMFPDSVLPEQRFALSQEDYAFLYRMFSMYPRESGIEEYHNGERYPDGYVKFLLYGGDEPRIPDSIRIFNKVGDAYGFLTDAAYIVDFDNAIEFMLAATIYVNDNETFNDDVYEYDEIGFPFMRNLGQAIYEIELKRERLEGRDSTDARFVGPSRLR